MTTLAMRHRGTGGVGRATQEQFDTLYKGRGWEIVDISPEFASEQVGTPIADLSELDRDQLLTVVAAHDESQVDALAEAPRDEVVAAAKAAGVKASGSKQEIAERVVAATTEAPSESTPTE